MTKNIKDKILVIGSANTDMVISAEHFPSPGETILGHGFMTNHGGKGANQAVAAARLGGDTTFIGKVGDDSFGHSTIEMMRQEGIDVSLLGVSKTASSGVALITTNASGENTIVVDSGANALLSSADIENAEAIFEQVGIVLMQLETPIDTLVTAAALGKKHGAYVVLNPAPAPKTPLPKELLANVDLLIPNETEAAYISGVEITDPSDIATVIDKIRQQGVGDVIVTVGSKGVCAVVDGEAVTVPAFRVKAVDTTAAGDTFCGALCVALAQGKSIEDAIRFGNKAASISVTRRGAQMSMPRLAELNS